MVRNTENILIDALQLPIRERAALASRLLASLDETVDEHVDAAWRNAITDRIREIDEGKVDLIPGDKVLGRLRHITRGVDA